MRQRNTLVFGGLLALLLATTTTAAPQGGGGRVNENDCSNPAFVNPVGGVAMPGIQSAGNEFVVNGNNFKDVNNARDRQCDVQNNLCFNAFNAAPNGKAPFQTSACANQLTACKGGAPVFAACFGQKQGVSGAKSPAKQPQDTGKQDGGKAGGKAEDQQKGNLDANICKNSNLSPADGTQEENVCVSTEMGELPTAANCPTQILVSPENGCTMPANKPFDIVTRVDKMNTGFFSDAATQYYVSSQELGGNGLINGHNHVAVQEIGDAKRPPSSASFQFFLGLNDPADGQGNMVANVKDGLPAGSYRVCTMMGSFTHQPVLCPKAKRGSSDDCVRFKVA